MTTMTRRRALLLGSSALGLLLGPLEGSGTRWAGFRWAGFRWAGLGWARATEPQEAIQGEHLVGLLRDPSAARLLGKAYLWLRGRRATRPELVERILPSSRRNHMSPADKRELRRAIRERAAHDFAAVRMVSAGGWMLSETEAQLCALAALEEDS